MNCARLSLVLLILLATNAAAVAPPQLWSDTWNGPGNHNDSAYLAAFSASGVLYVAGSTYEGGGDSENFFLRRYLPEGDEDWTVYHGEAGLDAPSDMVVADDGSILLTGYAREAGLNVVATIEYDDSGAVQWIETISFVGPPWLNSHPPALARDESGNVFVCVPSDDDYLVVKYEPGGTFAWSRTWDGPANGSDRCADVATDAGGNVYVTGMAATNEGGGQATGTVKWDADGTFQWDHIETGVFGAFFDFAAVEVSPAGNVVVAANPESSCGVFQARVWSLDPATGDEQWLESFPPEPCDSVEPVDMAIANDGKIAITGFGNVNSLDVHFQTLFYAADGTFQWHREFDGLGTSADIASSIEIDGASNVYVAGLTTFPPQNRDQAVTKYAPNGDEEWSLHWAGPSGTNDRVLDIAVSANGAVALVGETFDPAHQDDATVLLYQQQSTTAADPVLLTGPSMTATPNPFSSQTSIGFRPDHAGPARIRIFDLRGRLVRTLLRGATPVIWDGRDRHGNALPSGTYLLRMESPAGHATSRVSLVR